MTLPTKGSVMRGANEQRGAMISCVLLKARGPQDHPLRAVWSITHRALARLSLQFWTRYVQTGRPSVPAELSTCT